MRGAAAGRCGWAVVALCAASLAWSAAAAPAEVPPQDAVAASPADPAPAAEAGPVGAPLEAAPHDASPENHGVHPEAHGVDPAARAAAESLAEDPCLALAPPGAENDYEWLDKMEYQLRLGGCRSARWIDGLFGQTHDGSRYRQVHGNISPSLLWTEYDGLKTRVRFKVDLPLPQMDGRLRAFVGRVDREEFVTERAEPSGALPRQFGATGNEQTLLGLGYGRSRGRRGFDASAGIRVSTPLDPYLRASYNVVTDVGDRAVLRIRPTGFWQQSEQFGVTMRVDYDRDLSDYFFTRLTASGTYSGRSFGLRGYGNATLFQRLSPNHAIAYQVGFDGETELDVPMREYGVRTTYRQNFLREWLVLELRASLTWPREEPGEPREPSWGAGLGFEMVFGPGSFRGGD